MGKLKTYQAANKRFKFSKSGTIMKKHAGQDHFNAREPGKVTRAKRRRNRVANVDLRKIRSMLPYA
ncbi:MAG: 50S ribosomal protein L35 [Patescibacteria group bacterium]|nr:50S ribosomal protein L35 [Patescibacteria group bacterium]